MDLAITGDGPVDPWLASLRHDQRNPALRPDRDPGRVNGSLVRVNALILCAGKGYALFVLQLLLNVHTFHMLVLFVICPLKFLKSLFRGFLHHPLVFDCHHTLPWSLPMLLVSFLSILVH